MNYVTLIPSWQIVTKSRKLKADCSMFSKYFISLHVFFIYSFISFPPNFNVACLQLFLPQALINYRKSVNFMFTFPLEHFHFFLQRKNV